MLTIYSLFRSHFENSSAFFLCVFISATPAVCVCVCMCVCTLERRADTDSGLGRATPPRRAPSPGMGPSGRHLPSPSGPGSLPPGFMNKRRIFDDGSSDISSAASSMMEYSGWY